MNNTEKLRILLPHWIEHNDEHGREFQRWAKAMEEDGNTETAEALVKAAAMAAEVSRALDKALKLAGGPLGDHSHHHHHHHEGGKH